MFQNMNLFLNLVRKFNYIALGCSWRSHVRFYCLKLTLYFTTWSCCYLEIEFNPVFDHWQKLKITGWPCFTNCRRFPEIWMEELIVKVQRNFTISSVSSSLINSSHFHLKPLAFLLFFNTVPVFLPGWKGPRPDWIVWGAQLTQSRSSWSCYCSKLPIGRSSHVSAYVYFLLQT